MCFWDRHQRFSEPQQTERLCNILNIYCEMFLFMKRFYDVDFEETLSYLLFF